MSFKRLAALAAVFMLAACAGQPEIPFDQSSAHVKTIGVITPALPSGPGVVLASDVGQSFGLIGALVDAGMQANRDTKFTGLLAEQKFVAADQFTQALSASVGQRGYTVVPVAVTRTGTDMLKQLPPSSSPVDAYLDVAVLGWGYMAAGIGNSTPYRPYVILQCKLERASDSQVLMQDFVAFNPINTGFQKMVTLTDGTYQFENFDALMADPSKTAEGMRTAFQKSTDAIGTLLK